MNNKKPYRIAFFFSLILVITSLSVESCDNLASKTPLPYISPLLMPGETTLLTESSLQTCSNYPNIIIKMKSGDSFSSIDTLPLKLKNSFKLGNSTYYQVEVTQKNAVTTQLEILNKNDAVAYAEPDYLATLSASTAPYTPDDPFYTSYQYSLALTNSNSAISTYGIGGKIVDVAVIDTGLNFAHEEFQDFSEIFFYSYFERVEESGSHTYSFNSADPNLPSQETTTPIISWDDNPGETHGSHVTGIIGAATNSKGIVGVCPKNINLYMFKSFASSSVGKSIDGSGSDWSLYSPLNILMTKQATPPTTTTMVVNMSFGGERASKLGCDMISQAVEKKILIIAAAGNESIIHYEYPASYSEVISVSSVNATKEISSFSSGSNALSVSAPGENIYSVGGVSTDEYKFNSGTSMAAPFVTGLAAYILTFDNEISPAMLKTLIEDSAEDLGPTGWDSRYGYGMVNVKNAIDLQKARTTENRYRDNSIQIKYSGTNASSTDGKVVYLYKENKFYSISIIREIDSNFIVNFNLLPAGNYSAKLNFNDTIFSKEFIIEENLNDPTGYVSNFEINLDS